MHRLVALLLVVCLTTQEVVSLNVTVFKRSKSANEARMSTSEVVIGRSKKQQQHAKANLAYSGAGSQQPGVWRVDESHDASTSRTEAAVEGYDRQEAEDTRYSKYEQAEQQHTHNRQHRQQEEEKASDDYTPYYAKEDEPVYQNKPQQQQRYQQEQRQYEEEQATPQEPNPQEPPSQAKERQTEYYKHDSHCPTAQLADDVKQAYISHATFTWRLLATVADDRQAAAAAAAKVQTASHSVDQEIEEAQIGLARAYRRKDSMLDQLAKQQSTSRDMPQATAKALASGTPKATAKANAKASASGNVKLELQQTKARVKSAESKGKSGQHSASSASGVTTASSSTAAEDSLKFLLPTSTEETGYGYYGVRAQYLPADQAIAVGPHPIDPDGVMVIQGAQGSFEINMVMLEDGQPLPSVTGNRVYMDDIMEQAGLDTKNMYGLNPSAWFDPKDKRYVLMWATAIIDDNEQLESNTSQATDAAFPLIMVVSANSNPLGDWTVWVLDSVPQVAPGFKFCAGQPRTEYAANSPQGTFTDDAIVVAMGVYCGSFKSDESHSFLSVMYAYSKKALYSKPPKDSDCKIYAATYLSSGAWYRSVPPTGQALVEDKFKPFNNYIQPARPQCAEDMSQPPSFVMKASDTLLSIATLTGEPMADMHSIDSAPRLVATLVGKGADFSNNPDKPEGIPAMPQPASWRTLDAGDVGTANRTFGLRAYSAVQHKGLLYLTTSEYWGGGEVRMPSIYYAVVQPDEGLCSVSRLDWGLVASQEGLATAYPVIAARTDGSATIAFSYSGSGDISDGLCPAYPGVGYTTVGQSHAYGGSNSEGVIQVVKRGTGVIDKSQLADPQYWGTYSAAQVWADKMWFAVVIPQAVKSTGDSETQQKHGSWVSAVDLS